jgi:hypothetical protein
VLRGGFAQYYGQGVGLSGALSLLGSVTITFANTTSRTCWNDANGDSFVSRDELNFDDPTCIQYPNTFDPETALRTQSLNEVDPNLKNDRTTEFTAGIEHELLPNFAVGVSYIRRNYDRFRHSPRIGESEANGVAREWTPEIAGDAGEPIPPGLPGGYIYYEFDPTLVRPGNITRTINNDQERVYNGVDLTVTKRFSDRWMMNGAVTLQRTVTNNLDCTTLSNGRPVWDCTGREQLEGRSRGTEYIVKLNGMYALPMGVNASANLQIQQGQNRNITFDGPPSGFRSEGVGDTLGAINLVAYPYGTEREPLVHLLDAQVTKVFDMRGGRNRLNLIFSVFNVLNANTVRAFNNDLNSSNFDTVTGILAPRVARIQASITF